MGDIPNWHESAREVEAMLLAAGGYVRASDDLRPRVLEGARLQRRELRARRLTVPFKAVTLVNHLADGTLVADLASVGMRAVGFGIENNRPLTDGGGWFFQIFAQSGDTVPANGSVWVICSKVSS